MSVSGPGRVIDNGLVLYLDASNNKSYVSGSNTWFDVSRNGNNGTLTNGPTYTSSFGGSIVFDGTNDYINCGTGVNCDSLTLSVWASFNTSSNQMLLTKGNWNNNLASYSLIYYNNQLRFDTFLNDTTYGVATYNFSPILNTWYNIAFVANSNTSLYSGYINGTSITFTSTTTYRQPRTGSYTVYIGINSAGNYPFNGRIAQAQIYNRALSSSEILQNYNLEKKRFGL